MITIPQVVQNLVKAKPFVEEALNEGIINHSALARQLLPEIETLLKKEVKEGAVIMALKRMPISVDRMVSIRLTKIIKALGDITVRSNLTDFTFFNSDTLRANERLLVDLIKDRKEGFYTISRGVYETTLVVSSIFSENVQHIFKVEKLLSSTTNLSSITIRMPNENQTTPGLYYFIFKRLAENGINIIEIVSTTNEITIIVASNSVEKAFIAIKNLL